MIWGPHLWKWKCINVITLPVLCSEGSSTAVPHSAICCLIYLICLNCPVSCYDSFPQYVCPQTQFCYFTCRSSSFPYGDTDIGKSEVQKLYYKILNLISICYTCENSWDFTHHKCIEGFCLFHPVWIAMILIFASSFVPCLNIGFSHGLFSLSSESTSICLFPVCFSHYPLLLLQLLFPL